MVFNSFEFLIFLPVVLVGYWLLFKRSNRSQNIFILFSSYLFYGWWDWRFLSLILLSTVVDYLVGLRIHISQEENKKKWLWVSVLFNLGLLGFFKYFNFFVDSWVDMFSVFGYEMSNSWTLKVVLPVGISFYTFQTMSYSFDIYYKNLKPTKDFLSFATFVSFFPQLVAGPIERASSLLPQIESKRSFNYNQFVSGIKLILWGLFKKIAIADALGVIVNDIFENYHNYPASTLILGVFLFSFQIYGDFSGYSDIAIGTAKLFGIELMSNFKFPYFSRTIAEFWRRWHISLSSWFRYYIYIPLGGSRQGNLIAVRNIMLVFLISGLWHGAKWTFVFWGLLHGLAFIPVFLLRRNTAYKQGYIGDKSVLPSLNEILRVILVFSIVSFSWVFFRSESLIASFGFIKRVFTEFSFEIYLHPSGYRMMDYFLLIGAFVFYEYLIRKDERAPFDFKYKGVRFILYTLVIFMILLFYDNGVDKSFIYFQF